MAQFARPIADFTNIGPYTASDGSTDLWSVIDETVASDADYVRSPSNPAGTERYAATLSSISDPAIHTGHIVRYRIRKNLAAGRGIDINVFLVDGDTGVDVASWTHTNNSDVWTGYAQTLTTEQAALITNYGNLRFRFDPTSTGGGQGREAWLSWAELEVPDPPPNLPRPISDTVTIGTDSVARALTLNRTAADTTTVTDAAQATAAGRARLYDARLTIPGAVRLGGAFAVTATDTVSTGTGTVTRVIGIRRSTTDTTTVTDSVLRRTGVRRLHTDTTTITDTVTRAQALRRTATDTTTVTDSVPRVVARRRTATDTSTIGADTVGSVGSVYRRPLDDATVQSDTITTARVLSRTTTDTTSVTDAVARSGTFTRAFSDATTVGDAVNGQRRNPTQFRRPTADVSGNWHGEDARTTGLYTSIDDDPFNDTTYIESPDSPTSTDVAEFSLPATDPETGVGHVLRYRYGGEGSATLVVELRQGSTVIASWAHVNPAAPALAEQTLSVEQADAITDYADLRIRVRAL